MEWLQFRGEEVKVKHREQTKFRNLWSGCFEQVARSLRKVPSIRIEIRNKGGITFTVN
ncbi:ribosome maturation factor RimP [Peribacillus frigoritolerans]|nr:ribosome maturation factor RimP [Peribacillus frigoritolerans]